MFKNSPTFDDANLVLRLYDLRREPVLRESRNLMNGKFWPKSYEEFIGVTDPAHPMNAAFRQVSSYWEMVYGFAKHGIAHPEFLAENCGEGLFFFARLKPYVEQYRAEVSPTAFENTLWIISNSTWAAKRLEMMEKRIKQIAAKN